MGSFSPVMNLMNLTNTDILFEDVGVLKSNSIDRFEVVSYNNKITPIRKTKDSGKVIYIVNNLKTAIDLSSDKDINIEDIYQLLDPKLSHYKCQRCVICTSITSVGTFTKIICKLSSFITSFGFSDETADVYSREDTCASVKQRKMGK